MDVQTSNDMDTLIDLNAGIEEERTWSDAPSMRSEASVLRMGETTPEMRRKSTWVGFGLGLLVGLIPAAVAVVTTMKMWPENIFFGALTLGVCSAVGILINQSLLGQEKRDGYLKVDWEALEYWTRGGIVTISMGDIFGAGPEKGFLKEILRVCVVADNKRGFEFKKPGFDGYVAESGAARKIGGSIETGNALVRKTIIYHMQDRRKKGLRVSELPEYRFKSVQAHREFLIAGDVVEDAKFDCDGKTLVYEKKSERWEIPVRSVRKTSVHEARSQYGRTAYRVTLELDPSSGYEELKMDILRMSNAEEIDRYCRCLPTVFPRKELDGYWS
jgi:hypothetical protein